MLLRIPFLDYKIPETIAIILGSHVSFVPMYDNENKELNHITSENIVKEFKKLTKARKSWNRNVSKRGPKRKSGNVTRNVKRLKVKPEPT